ncbi:hypothetical protein [Streptantibioticus cattleyicolor]|uniref:Uncharacterized protein n=1 Tax=Streptantibioticus cattleyicolor (strain ATCC 35852 / DSM 46488 / JCM 4925 / NBRC 14057 / NRRL 8057) TaxID=1003195 RepID=G8XDK6_STREN|nr:hypothetical protein [Streptantibioticus cattleyicolor]AEW98200.1 hypothetical protein SCATT_p00070 [Streptantibioticus cattleyicolor NRRL 8057 = DSM 46488]
MENGEVIQYSVVPDAWERFDMTCTRFLVGVLDATIRSEILWSQFPTTPHEFRRSSEFVS